MDIDQAKQAAINNASKLVASYLSRPDQLDKVEQIRRRVMRNKASVDSRLKTAVQSQIDDIRSGLQELKNAQSDISDLKKILSEVTIIFEDCKPLHEKLEQVTICHDTHAKLSKTNVHLKQIFNVPETISKTRELISESKFLQAHKNIMELESTRDELLFEVFKLSKDSVLKDPIEQSPIYQYFAEVEQISDLLSKQLWTVIDRTLSAARSNPTQIVTAMRIIEREERWDKRSLETQKSTGFLPPGRPKYLRQRCEATLRNSVDNRFDSNQIELADKSNKMWLVRHLERMRKFILEDLLTIKHLVRPCFPPNYNIFKQYVMMYHAATSRTLEKFAWDQSNPNECVMLLSWINDYDGPELLGHEELKEYVDEFKGELDPILSAAVIDRLMETYVSTTAKNIQSWLEKMVETETQDWYQDKLPETDTEGCYQTSLPIILFQMLDQNLQVGAFIKQDVKLKIVDVSVESLNTFISMMRDIIVNYKMKCLENRSSYPYFEAYMVAIANNCISITEFADQMKNQLKAEIGEETFGQNRIETFNKTVLGYEELSREVCSMLLEGAFSDLEPHFQDLLTRKWLKSNIIVETLVATIEDYVNDYSHLRDSAYKHIMKTQQEQIIIEYVKACMSRKITFKEYEERRDGADQLIKEANRIAETFTRLAMMPAIEETPCDVLVKIAEVLKVKDAKDPVLITLELSGLASAYKDFQQDHALALLALRGDMGRTECRQTVAEISFHNISSITADDKGLIFSKVMVAGTVLDKLESKLQMNTRE